MGLLLNVAIRAIAATPYFHVPDVIEVLNIAVFYFSATIYRSCCAFLSYRIHLYHGCEHEEKLIAIFIQVNSSLELSKFDCFSPGFTSFDHFF